jgi:hypothetical protein
VNHLGHFALTNLLAPIFRTDPARCVRLTLQPSCFRIGASSIILLCNRCMEAVRRHAAALQP